MNNNNNKEKDTSWQMLAIVIIVIWLYFSALISQRKIVLEAIKTKIEENKELDNALEIKIRKIFFIIRCGSFVFWFFVNWLVYFIKCQSFCFDCMDKLLSCNNIIFIIFSALTFAKYGSFNSYHKWWRNYETNIKVHIYRKYPNLKTIISNDIKYKEELEKEIEELDKKTMCN